jgi:hypothetical protein
MVAASIFNKKEENSIKTIYGVVTTGEIWQFLKLEDDAVFLDAQKYYITTIDKIFGILLYILTT